MFSSIDILKKNLVFRKIQMVLDFSQILALFYTFAGAMSILKIESFLFWTKKIYLILYSSIGNLTTHITKYIWQ